MKSRCYKTLKQVQGDKKDFWRIRINMVENPENPGKRICSRGQLIAFKIMEESGQGEYFAAYAKNISRGGFFIVSMNPREHMERFHITFQIPDTDITIRCQCEVIWTRKYDPATKLEPGYGIRFIDLPEDIENRINNWVLLQGL